jgi:4-amino-4-deoxy-L-arabinose transferase-like glycosyltransferase
MASNNSSLLAHASADNISVSRAEITALRVASARLSRTARHIAVFGAVFGLALMVWTWVRAASMSADGAHYMELAERACRLGARAGMDWYSGPGYPVAVSWMYRLFRDLDFAGRLTSFAFGAATLIGVGLLGYRLFGRTVAYGSVAILAVHTTFVRHAVMAETDAMYGACLVWSILLVWELRHASRAAHIAFLACSAAVTLGVGYLTRPEAVPLAGLLCLWYLFAKGNAHDRSGGGRRAVISIAIAAIFLVIASPYLVELHRELGRWSLSGKERSIILKFVPDRANYEEALKLGVSGALLYKPVTLLRWLPYHVYWGLPQLVKSLNPIVLVLATFGMWRLRRSAAAAPGLRLLLWVSVPFLLFFFLTFPGRRYFMQAMPQWTIFAAAGTVELARLVARWRSRRQWDRRTNEKLALTAAALARRGRRAIGITLAAPAFLMIGSTLWGNRVPIEQSLTTERAIGERILQVGGAGRRVLSFTVSAFYARGERVPLWGPMQGVVRAHGYGQPLTYDEFVAYVKRNGVEYVVLDQDLRADCPQFLERVQPQDFELVADDIADHHGPHLVYRAVTHRLTEPRAN